MTGFTKLWAEILSSSIWNESDKVRIVWVTMLAAMGPDYVVRASVGGLAHLARVSREDCEKALEVLSGPDPDSRSKEHEGRRIEATEGGYLILNGGKYREARNHDERKSYMASYMKEYRRKHAVNTSKQVVNNVNSCKPPLAQAEAEAEAEADVLKNPPKEPAKQPTAPKPRNAIFDAIAEVDGLDPLKLDGKGGKIAKAKQIIIRQNPDVTPDEIRRRAAVYRLVMPPDSMLTATALANNWHRCAKEPEPSLFSKNGHSQAVAPVITETRASYRDANKDVHALIPMHQMNEEQRRYHNALCLLE